MGDPCTDLHMCPSIKPDLEGALLSQLKARYWHRTVMSLERHPTTVDQVQPAGRQDTLGELPLYSPLSEQLLAGEGCPKGLILLGGDSDCQAYPGNILPLMKTTCPA